MKRIELSFEHHGEVSALQCTQQGSSLAEDKNDPVLLVELFKHGKPLFQLIELRAAVSEIDDNFCPDIATIELVFKAVPSFGASDPFARSLPCRRPNGPEGRFADQILHGEPFSFVPNY